MTGVPPKPSGLSLRTRFIISIILIEAVLMAVLIWNGGRIVLSTHQERLAETGRQTAELFSQAVSQNVVEEDFAALQELAQTCAKGEIVYAVVADALGKRLAQAGVPPETLQPGDAAALPDPKRAVHPVSHPIVLAGRERGTVHIGLSTALMRDAIRKDRNQGIGIALAVMLISTYVAFFLGTVLTKPLARLVEATRQIAAGRMDHRVTISSSDEIGLLAESFNRMADALQARQEEIASSYEELELTNEEIRTAYEQLENSQRELAQKNVSLKESEERYRNLVDSASEAILVLDASYGAILEANPETERLTGHGRDALMKMRLSDLLHASNPDEIVDAVRRSAAAGQGTIDRWPLVTKDGRTRICSISAVAIQHRGVPALLGVARDLTDQKAMEQRLVQTEKLSALGEMISGVAHEINNPLTGILGYSELLLENEEVPAAARRRLEVVHHEANRMKKIVQNLLAFARQSPAEKVPLDIGQVLRAALDLRAYEIKVNNIALKIEIQPGLPVVMGDALQLEQVFLNLINNAYHAMLDRPEPRVLTLAARPGSSPETVEVEVCDTGGGIAPQILSRVFDPFFTTKKVGEGTGLGLSLSYGIVSQHGGEIRVESEVGKGTLFRVTLPAMRAPVPREEPAPAPPVPAATAAKKILIVDDEPTIIDLLTEVLQPRGHGVKWASDGRGALEILNRESFDIVISDIKMPGLSGRDLYEAIRNDSRRPALPVAFITGDTVSEETRRFLEETRAPYLAKPFRPEDVLDLLRRLFPRG